MRAVNTTADSTAHRVTRRLIRREAGLKPEPLPVNLVRREHLLVAEPARKTPALREGVVERTRRSLR